MKFYGWKTPNEIILSFMPSLKYGFTLKLLSISSVIAYLETTLFGFKIETIFALGILLFVELVSGIYNSVFIKKEPFESKKMWRFFFKTGIFFVIVYVMNQLKNEFETKEIFRDIFNWVYVGVISYAILENVISVLENYAEIQGKQKDYYTYFITEKLKVIFGKNEKNNNDTDSNDPAN